MECTNLELKNFYLSIFIRVDYGTMTCDKIFLKNLANRWLDRYNKNKLNKYYDKISYENIKTDFNFNNFKFEKNNKLLNGVDFHCNKTLFNDIRTLTNLHELSNLELKSSPNIRDFLIKNKKVREFIKEYEFQQEKNKNTFDKIKESLDILSKDYWIKNTNITNSLLNYFSL